MINVEDFEPRVLTIVSENPDCIMNIIVGEFLDVASITQIRKLLKLIDNSEDPRKVEVLENYIAEWKLRYEPEQKEHARLCVEYRTQTETFLEDSKKYKAVRDKFKKGSATWQKYQDIMEAAQNFMKDAKATARRHELEFAANKRTKEKFEKLLIYMQL